MTATDRQFLIESLCEDIVPMMDPETGLYYQSPVYVFDMLKEEFNAD